MINKYQEALNHIKEFISENERESLKESFATLQELLDKCCFLKEKYLTENGIDETFLVEVPMKPLRPQTNNYEN